MIEDAGSDNSNTSPVVAEDWDNDDGGDSMQRQLEERFKQVKILKREQADKEARIEQARADEQSKVLSGSDNTFSMNAAASPSLPPMKMQILRRPRSDEISKAEKLKQQEEERKRMGKPTLEQRQAAYDEARSRILGVDYKPEPAAVTPEPATVPNSRNKSPEQIRVRRPSPETVPAYSSLPLAPHHQSNRDPSVDSKAVWDMSLPTGNYVDRDRDSALDSKAIWDMSLPTGTYPSPMMGSMPYLHTQPNTQPFMPYFDTSRPPPPMVTSAQQQQMAQQYSTGPPVGQYVATGQYFPQGHGPNMATQPPSMSVQVPFGRPPMAIYPPGSLGAAMQVKVESGQSQSQRKNKKGKKTKGASVPE